MSLRPAQLPRSRQRHTRLTPARRLACLGVLFLVWHGSARAEPSTGECLDANERSLALRAQHRLLAARAQLLVCAAGSCPQDVRDECVRRVGEVNAQIPTLVLEARDAEGNDLSEVRVTLDDQPWLEHLDGTAQPIDPGVHQFGFKWLDGPVVTRRWILREAEKGRREPIVLGMAPAPTRAPQPTAARPESSRATRRVIGLAVGGLGIAGLGVALYEQLTARSHADRSQTAVDSADPAVRATSHALYQQAQRAQTYAIICGVAGAAALGTGLVLFITGLHDTETHEAASQRIMPAFATDGGGLHYVATF